MKLLLSPYIFCKGSCIVFDIEEYECFYDLNRNLYDSEDLYTNSLRLVIFI